jgi:lipoate-protein ligase A
VAATVVRGRRGVTDVWRLVIGGAGDGAWNMAVDRAILSAHEAGDVPPTLRLYTWSRPTVSLGRFQRAADVDLEACGSEGIGTCRRPTGGRGVLHDDELTYSLVSGVRDGLPRGVSASYRMLCGALVEAYREIGVPATLTARERGERGAGACYLHASDADLSMGAAKLSGSAQVWSTTSCLQHGSFVVSRDVAREARVFRLGEAGARALQESTDTIAGVLGRIPARDELTEAVIAGIGRGLGVRFEQADLSVGEAQDADLNAASYAVG